MICHINSSTNDVPVNSQTCFESSICASQNVFFCVRKCFFEQFLLGNVHWILHNRTTIHNTNTEISLVKNRTVFKYVVFCLFVCFCFYCGIWAWWTIKKKKSSHMQENIQLRWKIKKHTKKTRTSRNTEKQIMVHEVNIIKPENLH